MTTDTRKSVRRARMDNQEARCTGLLHRLIRFMAERGGGEH